MAYERAEGMEATRARCVMVVTPRPRGTGARATRATDAISDARDKRDRRD